MMKAFQNNCLLYKWKEDYPCFKKGKHQFAKKEYDNFLTAYFEKGRCLIFTETFYSVFEEVALEWE